jgi:hypothetical protein
MSKNFVILKADSIQEWDFVWYDSCGETVWWNLVNGFIMNHRKVDEYVETCKPGRIMLTICGLENHRLDSICRS